MISGPNDEDVSDVVWIHKNMNMDADDNMDQVSGWLRIKTAHCEFLQLSCSSLSALLLVEAPTWSSHLLVSHEDGDDMDAVRGRAIWWYRCWLFFWQNIRWTGLVNFLPHRPKIMRISWLEGGENVIMKTIMVIRSRMITILTIILAAPGNSNALLPTG